MDKASDDLHRLDSEAAALLDSAFAHVEGQTQVAKAQGDAGRALQGLAAAMIGEDCAGWLWRKLRCLSKLSLPYAN